MTEKKRKRKRKKSVFISVRSAVFKGLESLVDLAGKVAERARDKGRGPIKGL